MTRKYDVANPCKATRKGSGDQCRRPAVNGKDYCEAHMKAVPGNRDIRAYHAARKAAAELALEFPDDYREVDVVDVIRQTAHRLYHLMNKSAEGALNADGLVDDEGVLTAAGETWLLLNNASIRLTDALARVGLTMAALNETETAPAPVDKLRALLDGTAVRSGGTATPAAIEATATQTDDTLADLL